MRRVRYCVVTSLDGYIAGPKGEADWITSDPDFDFAALFSQFDTILVGRRTFDTMVAAHRVSIPGIKTIVFSRTLKPQIHPEVTIVANHQQETLAALKANPEKISGCSVAANFSVALLTPDSSTQLKSGLSRSFSVPAYLCVRN